METVDSIGIGLSALILSGTMAVVSSTASETGPFAWRAQRVADACPAAVIGGCRPDDGPVLFHAAKPR